MIHFLLIQLFVIWAYMTFWYLWALALKRNDLADIAWGFGFLVASIVALKNVPYPQWRAWVLPVLVGIWACRLSFYIGRRNWGKPEDFRYQNWRKEWGKTFIWRSYLQVFILQGIILFVIGLPIWLGIRASAAPVFRLWDVLGIGLWGFGTLFEATADWQMARHKKAHSAHRAVMNKGLWRYSRHPNYFGESVLWWGLFIFSCSNGAPLWTIVGPIALTFSLLKVSGVPMLEKKYEQNKHYLEYQQTTSSFIPWFPRK